MSEKVKLAVLRTSGPWGDSVFVEGKELVVGTTVDVEPGRAASLINQGIATRVVSETKKPGSTAKKRQTRVKTPKKTEAKE